MKDSQRIKKEDFCLDRIDNNRGRFDIWFYIKGDTAKELIESFDMWGEPVTYIFYSVMDDSFGIQFLLSDKVFCFSDVNFYAYISGHPNIKNFIRKISKDYYAKIFQQMKDGRSLEETIESIKKGGGKHFNRADR